MSALWCRFWLLASTVALWIVALDAKEFRIVCYYTNWSVYRPGDAKFNPQNINPYLCTHLIYAFGGFTKENTLKPFDKYQDIEKGGYAKFVGLKTYNKNLKTLLAIGGWNEGSSRFSPMVANPDRRKELVKNTIKFLRQNHFDGLDLDWEYPSFRDGGKSRDRDNYAQLVQELREEFDRESEKTGRPRLLLTMAVPAGIEYINKGYDIPKLTQYLDWMNILSYDYHSAYEPAVNHHSPLYPIEEENEYSLDIDLNIDYTIKHYMKKGADRTKLVVGIPTYGRSYTLYNPDANEIGSPADGPGEMGDATRENGYLAYYEICEKLKSDDWIIEAPYPDDMGPYAYKDNQWVGYDDEDIARKKAEYVAKNGLGGIMFWSIDNDDFRGKCGDRPYPIIEAAKEALLKAYGLSDASLLATTKKPVKTRTKTRGTTRTVESTTESLSTVRLRQNSRRKNVNRVNGEETKPASKRRPSSRRNKKKQETTTSISSLVITPSYTTPAPPSTPDSGGDFKCEDEGFFPHPKDCKKYFWCLSGPSELGIVAHQFTCPAGLYFNKAAASCDYSQNVLCNKKLTKATTTTTTTSPTSSTIASTSLSTRRPPAKITAATSRTTVTTTEPPAEEEDEDYDEEYEDEEGTAGENAEQDPRVIKELIQLIRKAGGIEELEKQLKISEGGNIGVDSTTRSTINKSLYEKVLSRATATLKEQKRPAFKTYNTIGRNSRGPQNEGLEQPNETPSRGRPQYTSIVRSRPSTEASDIKPVYEEDEEDVEQPSRSRPFYKKNQPEYVTIRRQRITTTTETSAAENSRPQFKQLGESETPDEDVQSKYRSSTTSSPYVTIKRFRPTTETIESGNEEIAHTEPSEEDSSTPPPEYVAVKRQRPNATQENATTTRYLEVRGRGTTTTSSDETSSTTQESKEEKPYRTIDESANSVEENTVENTDTNATEQTVNNNNNNNNSNNDTLKDVVDNIKEIINSQKQEEEHETLPVLSDPRPFSLTPRTRPSTTTEEIPKDVKVSVSSPRNVLRNKILEARIPPSSKNVNNQEINTDDEKNNDVLDDEDRQNRFSTRHRFSTETAKEDNQIVRIRGRGHSRFTAHTVATTTIRTRPITRITEKPYTDYEAIEYNRKYRPDIVAEISDLSSLLAVDLKDLQAGRKFGRRRRPVTQTTSTSTTTLPTSTTTELDESLKTGSRTLPVARKLLDGSKFGRANRFRSTTTTTTTTTENQPKQEDEVSERPVKIFKRPFSKNPNLLDGSRLNRFRKASINTTEEATTSTTRPLPIRRRIVLRKLKKPTSTTTTTESSTTTTEKQSPPETTTESLKTTTVNLKTTTTENLKTTTIENPKTTTENLKTTTENLTTTTENLKTATENLNVMAETLKPTENETENEKTTTEKENTTFLNDVIESTRTSNDDTDDDKSEEADDNEEGENIKLSESIVRENSQNFGNIIQEGLKLGKLADKSYKSIGKDLIFDERPSTEPSFSVRTRKIIKKLSTTESPVFTAEGEAPKFKKVVRKLKLTTASGNSLGEDEKPIEVSTASLLNKGRRKFGETEAEYDEEREGRKYGFKRPSYLTTAKIKEKEDDEAEQELGVVKGLEAKKAIEEETLNPIKPPFKLNRPLFRRRKINTSNAGDNRPENNDKRPLFTRRKFGSSTFKPIQEENKELNLNKALYNRRIPTFTVYSTTSTPSPSSTTETTIQYETEEDNTISTITTEAETELNEEITTETASIDKTEIVYTTAVAEETTLEDLTTTNRNEETTDQTTLKAANVESSTIKYGSTRYGEISNTTSLPPSTRKGKLYFKNKQYGTNSVLENTDKNKAVRKIASTTESALSKLLKRRKEHKKVVAIEEDIKVREENTRVREEEIKILEEETDIGRKRTKVLEEETKVREEEIKVHEEETKLRKKEEDGEEEGITVVNTNKPENDFFTDVITTQVQTTTNENEGEVKTTMLQDIQDKTEFTTENIPTTVEDLSTLTEDLSPTTTESKNDEIITTTEYVTTTTTTRKPSRLFRPIGLRPKFTGRIKSSEPSTTSTPIISTSERFKTNRFNKFKVKPTPKRFIPTSTIENEDLAYGPIKEFKPAFRPSLYRQRNKFVSEKEEDKQEEEEEEEDADSDDYVEEDVTEVDEKQHPRPNLFSKPGYIILKPSPNAHDEVVNEENDEDENDEEEKTFSSSNPSNIYFSSTSKPSTRLYKKFTTPSPVTVAQNLSDVNITAVNQRNKNLFNKTRKMNTPFAGVTAKIDANKTADNSYQLSLLTSTKQDDVTEKVSPTTDRATTLLHIFSENENPNETTLSYSPNDEPPEKKIEKIVEINRIVKVTAKVNNGTNVIETEGTDKPEKVDRLLVSRVTEIKVVEGQNGTNRQEKKYEGGRRTDNDFNIPLVTSSDVAQINQIHIDSASSIVKKITPKPFYTVESATIPLEGLFQANTPKVDLQNELLEGENSNYVNVRVLQQESPNKLSRMATNAKFIPVRILKDEDEIIMKADVVEVTPSASKQQIKIVPISVSIQTT